MKYGYMILAVIFAIMGSVVWASPAVKEFSPAAYVDVEMPFRCMPPGSDKQISETISLTPDDFSFVSSQQGDMLPRYAVNGYTFHNTPVNEALEKLVASAGIKVIAPPAEYIELDGENVKGELSSIVAQLAETADVFYTYKASTKTLKILGRTEVTLSLPKNKVVLMAMLDALRGSQILNVDVDWEKYQLRMNVSPDELRKAKRLVNQILKDKYLLAVDVQVYQATPKSGADWQGVLNKMAHKISSIGRAIVGRSVVLSTGTKAEDFLDKAVEGYSLEPVVGGAAVVPNSWQMRFKVNECSNFTLPYPDMSLVMKTSIKDEQHMRTQVTLHTAGGVASSFDLTSGLNQEVILLGLPAKIDQTEVLFVLRFNLVRFVEKGV